MKTLSIVLLALFFAINSVSANQISITFSEDSLGALGDYEKTIGSWELALDAQAQRSNSLSTVLNASVMRSFGSVGIKPFGSYSRDDIGNIADVGGLLNFSLGGLDIAAGASFRGANPTAVALEKRFDANDVEVEVHSAGYSPNAYQLPVINNINAVLTTGFEYRKVETDLTVYIPMTEREIVPIVIISRSQSSIALAENLSLALVVDARTYIHADGAEIAFKPLGAITYKF